jgi:hypothetical protein
MNTDEGRPANRWYWRSGFPVLWSLLIVIAGLLVFISIVWLTLHWVFAGFHLSPQ